jgi:hypothetical protein
MNTKPFSFSNKITAWARLNLFLNLTSTNLFEFFLRIEPSIQDEFYHALNHKKN